MKSFFSKLLLVAGVALTLSGTASAYSGVNGRYCTCYGVKYIRTFNGLTSRQDFIGNFADKNSCDIMAGRLGYDAFSFSCGY